MWSVTRRPDHTTRRPDDQTTRRSDDGTTGRRDDETTHRVRVELIGEKVEERACVAVETLVVTLLRGSRGDPARELLGEVDGVRLPFYRDGLGVRRQSAQSRMTWLAAVAPVRLGTIRAGRQTRARGAHRWDEVIFRVKVPHLLGDGTICRSRRDALGQGVLLRERLVAEEWVLAEVLATVSPESGPVRFTATTHAMRGQVRLWVEEGRKDSILEWRGCNSQLTNTSSYGLGSLTSCLSSISER